MTPSENTNARQDAWCPGTFLYEHMRFTVHGRLDLFPCNIRDTGNSSGIQLFRSWMFA